MPNNYPPSQLRSNSRPIRGPRAHQTYEVCLQMTYDAAWLSISVGRARDIRLRGVLYLTRDAHSVPLLTHYKLPIIHILSVVLECAAIHTHTRTCRRINSVTPRWEFVHPDNTDSTT